MNCSLKKDDVEGLFTEDEIEELNQQLRKQEMILKAPDFNCSSKHQ